MNKVLFPFGYYPDSTRFGTLALGQLYIGTLDAVNPIVSQKQAYSVQESGAPVAIAQPILLSAGGVPQYNGSDTSLEVDGQYSILILDADDNQEYYLGDAGPETAEDILPTATENQVLQKGASVWEVRDKNEFPVEDYGTAVGDGTSAQDALTAAVAAAKAAGGGVVKLASGTFLLSATITVDADNIFIEGSGSGTTNITRSTDYGDTFFFTGSDSAGTTIDNTGISGFKIGSTAATTSGAHIHMNGVTRANISDIYMQNGFIGFKFAGLTATVVDNIYLAMTNNYSLASSNRRGMIFRSAHTNYGHSSCGDVFVSNFNIRGNATATAADNTFNSGIEINSGDGIWFSNGHVGNAVTGDILFDMDFVEAEQNNMSLVFFDNVMFDAHTGACLYFVGSTTNAPTNIGRNISFSNCHLKGGSGAGVDSGNRGIIVQTDAAYTNVQFSNCTIQEHASHGVYCLSSAAYNWAFTGCQVRGNSNFVSEGAYGYNIVEGDKWQIVGGQAGGHATSKGGTTRTKYGINVGANPSHILIDGVDCRGNITADINIEATNKGEVKIRGCLIDLPAATVNSVAGNIELPSGKDFIWLDGTAAVTSITATFVGDVVNIKGANASASLVDGSNLLIVGNWTASTDALISLVCDGTNWNELSRTDTTP